MEKKLHRENRHTNKFKDLGLIATLIHHTLSGQAHHRTIRHDHQTEEDVHQNGTLNPPPDGIFLHKLIDLFSRQQTAETGFLLDLLRSDATLHV